MTLPAQTITTLVNFDVNNGVNPFLGSLVQGLNGEGYGTTYYGGTASSCFGFGGGCGTVFKMTPSGKLTTLHSFDGTDGIQVSGGLVQAANGEFYGTTARGGAYGDNYIGGTVFKITPNGTLTTLYNFCAQTDCTDGELPFGGLVQATNGDFYGTTEAGGASLYYGTIFKITSVGKLTTLHNFCTSSSCTDGAYPYGVLLQAADGNLYGTTFSGGNYGDGTIFKITPAGRLATLYTFSGTDGANPLAGLVQATDGNFYGTTRNGGTSNDCTNGCGTVFKITQAGKLTSLHSFSGTDGYPYGALVQATDGNFYGTTSGAAGFGSAGNGTIFKVTPSGKLTTLYTFNGTDGSAPYAGLVQATNGSFYGTTDSGGLYGDGTVFSLSVGLGPFATTLPTAGKVGSAVKILGPVTGATSVTFNGVAAAFKIVSASEVTTTVPTGATTGIVQVVTPAGSLSSNVAFRVGS
jgi:uncharacterized repeat protein (TIGR03803 family)